MGIKRQIDDNAAVSTEKKSKANELFSMSNFVKNLKDPESSFLALVEFNEHAHRLTSTEQVDEFMNNLVQTVSSNVDDILVMMTDEKRKSSEVSSRRL
jgi:hypothetical protein